MHHIPHYNSQCIGQLTDKPSTMEDLSDEKFVKDVRWWKKYRESEYDLEVNDSKYLT